MLLKHHDLDLLQDMSGNMWNLWSYVPVKMASVGCINWRRARELTEQHREKRDQAKLELDSDDESASLSSSAAGSSCSNME